MDKLKCIAIDDEPIALEIIKEYCNRAGNIDLLCFTSPLEGMKAIWDTNPQVVFLDIEMHSHNGTDLARNLPPETCLIFTTAYAGYALEGYNLNAIDFLHKPIFYPRFCQAIDKARKWLERPAAALSSLTSLSSSAEAISLKVEHKNVIINLADILFVEAMDNYVKIFRRGLPMVLSQITMKEMETMLPADRFTRVHRSFIIANTEISRYSNKKLYLKSSDREIPLGRKYSNKFNELLSKITKK